MRVLVIEDHTDTRELIVEVLADEGYEVVSASNGTHGLNLFKESPVDLVITDLFMPDTDGLQVVMALRSAVPPVKIITISGGGMYGDAASLKTSSMLGATFTLAKPFTPDQLLELVRRALPTD
jgi:CheY-like chemotaxis protein